MKPLQEHDVALWAITCYFNPCRYRRRLANYRVFRDRLTVPLVTVELSFGEPHELQANDADILIQLRGGDVMWQKERLLNVALAAVPEHCRKVAWVDCDVIFAEPDWARQTAQLLDDYGLVQPFHRAVELAPEVLPEQHAFLDEDRILSSLASEIATHSLPAAILKKAGLRVRWPLAGGFAWAGRREVFGELGLYDACVVGSGTKAVHDAAWGTFDHTVAALRMNRRRERHFRDWAVGVHERIRGRVSFAQGVLYHLWHGRLEDRSYIKRHRGFARFDFDPYEDIVLDGGVWRWNSSKPDMHRFVDDYFRGRREDD